MVNNDLYNNDIVKSSSLYDILAPAAPSKKKVFIIGSLTQEEEIINLANTINSIFNNIRYVHKQQNKSFEELVVEAFDNIEWAELVIVLRKHNGELGDGTTYELEYAKRAHKCIMDIYP